MQVFDGNNKLNSSPEHDERPLRRGFSNNGGNNCDSGSGQSNSCPLCDSVANVFDAESGEVICANCGMVMYESIELGSSDWKVFTTEKYTDNVSPNTRIPSSLAFYDRGLSTFIPNSRIDAHGFSIKQEQKMKIGRMRKWNSISNSSRSFHRNLRYAFNILITISDKMSLTDSVIEKSAYYYRKVVNKNIIKGRSIAGFVVASVYAACRELNIPRSLGEISGAVNTDPIFAGKCYRMLLRHLKLSPPSIDTSMCMSRIAKNAGVSERTYRRGLTFLKEVKENPMSYGKDPNALAAAVLYTACIKEGEKVVQSHIATAGNISIVTLRKRALDVIGAIS